MDIDLDDLSYEEEDFGYNPEEDEDEEEAVGLEVVGYTEHEEQEKRKKSGARIEPEWTDVERIQLLIESMPGNRKILMRIMEYCIEPKTVSEVDDYVYELQRSNLSVYSAVSFRRLLQEASALEYLPPEEPDDEEEEDEFEEIFEEATEEEIQDAIESAAVMNKEGEMQADTELASEVLTADISDNEWNDDPIIVDEPEYDVIKPRPEGLWHTTAAGQEYLEQDSPDTRMQDLLDRDYMYVDIYMRILEYCAESPKRIVVLEKHFGEELAHRKPRKYASFFVTELEKCDVLEWDEAWYTTDYGKEVLEKWRNGQAILETIEED
jgi:hypothetical protein